MCIDYMLIVNSIFSKWVVLGEVFDGNVLNEFAFNRRLYLNDVYMPRFKGLNASDLAFLRDIQLYAVTDKENKDGFTSTYPISIDDRVRMMNILSFLFGELSYLCPFCSFQYIVQDGL